MLRGYASYPHLMVVIIALVLTPYVCWLFQANTSLSSRSRKTTYTSGGICITCISWTRSRSRVRQTRTSSTTTSCSRGQGWRSTKNWRHRHTRHRYRHTSTTTTTTTTRMASTELSPTPYTPLLSLICRDSSAL